MLAQAKDSSVCLPIGELKKAILYIRKSDIQSQEVAAYRVNYDALKRVLANRDSVVLSLKLKDSLNNQYKLQQDRQIDLLASERDISLNRIQIVTQQDKEELKKARSRAFLFGGAGIIVGLILSIFIR